MMIEKDLIIELDKIIKSIPLANYLIFACIFLGTLMAYVYFGLVPTYDQEGLGSIASRLDKIGMNYVGAARPLLWFISAYIGTGSFLPLLNIIFACVLLSLCAHMVSKMLGAKRPLESVIIGLLFSTSPFWSATLSLHLWNLGFSISYLFTILAVFLTYFKRKWVVASFLLFLVYNIYQTSIGLYTAMVFSLLVVLPVWSDRSLKEILKSNTVFFIMSVKSLLCATVCYIPVYVCMSKISLGYAKTQNEKVSSIAEFVKQIYFVINTSCAKLIGRPSFHESMVTIFLCVVFLCLVVLFINNSFKKGCIKVIIGIPVFFLSILACFPISIFLTFPRLFDRVSTALAIVIAVFYAIPLLRCQNTIIRNCSLILSVITIYSFIQFHNVNSFSQQVTNMHNFSLATRIATEIESNPLYSADEMYHISSVMNKYHKVYAAGSRAYSIPRVTNVYGADFRWYITNHFRMIGLENVEFDWVGEASKAASEDLVKKMPKWPEKGSIQFLPENKIIIKF